MSVAKECPVLDCTSLALLSGVQRCPRLEMEGPSTADWSRAARQLAVVRCC